MVDTHGIDAEDILEIAELFFDTIFDNIDHANQAFTSGKTDDFVRIFHGIKGAAANIGFDEISDVAKILEAEAKRDINSVSDVSRQIDTLRRLIADRQSVIAP